MSGTKKTSRDLDALRWLVKSRSENQGSAVELYRLFEEHREVLASNTRLRIVAQTLLGINFSLWRAVFLSDVDRTKGRLMADAELFLKNLIENNTVAYQQDKNAKHWTFRYYVQSSRNSMRLLINFYSDLGIFEVLPKENKEADAGDWWQLHQIEFNNGIKKFEEVLKEASRIDDASQAEEGSAG